MSELDSQQPNMDSQSLPTLFSHLFSFYIFHTYLKPLLSPPHKIQWGHHNYVRISPNIKKIGHYNEADISRIIKRIEYKVYNGVTTIKSVSPQILRKYNITMESPQ